METLTKEEIRDTIKGFKRKQANHKVSWITDTLEVSKYTDPTTGEVTILKVDVVAEAEVRFGINYKNMKTVIARGELASRTKEVDGKEVVSRKREMWWKRPEQESTFFNSSLVYYGKDETKDEDERKWYLQMFRAVRPFRHKNTETGEMEKGSTPIVPTIKYIFEGEELQKGKSERDDMLLEGLAKLRHAHDIPEETWVKPISAIVSIK